MDNFIPSEQTSSKLNDLLDVNHIQEVVEDCDTLAFNAVKTFFSPGATKAPIKKHQLHQMVAYSTLIAQMQSVENLMKFIETNDIIDGYDPNHDLAQAIYGELCMYLLKLDKLLFSKYSVVSNINKSEIEKRSNEYIKAFEGRKERIFELQEQLKTKQLLQ